MSSDQVVLLDAVPPAGPVLARAGQPWDRRVVKSSSAADLAPRIVIIAADPLDGRGLTLLLRTSAGFDAIWAESIDRARRLLGSRRREVLLWSGDQLDGEQLCALASLRALQPALGVCAIAQRADAGAVERFLADDARRFALLLRGERPELSDLVTVIEGILMGRSLVEARVLEEILAPAKDPCGRLGQLTASEREILGLVASGLRNRAIAKRIWKSEKAVEKHVTQIFCKLGLQANGNADLDRRVAAARMFLLQPE